MVFSFPKFCVFLSEKKSLKPILNKYLPFHWANNNVNRHLICIWTDIGKEEIDHMQLVDYKLGNDDENYVNILNRTTYDL